MPTLNANLTGARSAASESLEEDPRPLHGGAKAGLAPDVVNRGSMVWIPGGDFIMGSNKFYREERPARRESVGGFWIDPRPVTNADFREFVRATGYLTTSERAPDPRARVRRHVHDPPAHRNARGVPWLAAALCPSLSRHAPSHRDRVQRDDVADGT